MLRTTPTQLAKNLPLSKNGAKDTKLGSGTSLTTRSPKNMSASVKIIEDAEVGKGDGGNDEIVKRSPLSKKSNIPTGYLTFLHSKKRCVSLDSFWPLLKLSVKGIIGKIIK